MPSKTEGILIRRMEKLSRDNVCFAHIYGKKPLILILILYPAVPEDDRRLTE